jgi:hypothetical protein
VLEEELRELSTKLVRLRRESGIPDWFFQQKEQLADKSLENARLRDAMHQQDMYLANASRLMLAEYMVRCRVMEGNRAVYLCCAMICSRSTRRARSKRSST